MAGSTRPPRARSARKVARPVPASARPLVEIDSAAEPDVEPIPVFSLDGQIFTMPGYVPASFSLEALERFRTDGEMAATAWMLEEMLGTEAYTALRGARSMSADQLRQIMDRVNEHVMGALESGKS